MAVVFVGGCGIGFNLVRGTMGWGGKWPEFRDDQ